MNTIQWCLYYPAIVDADELSLTTEEMTVLADSLAAYREGDLVAALERYPAGRDPQSSQERVYLAALWLAIGQVQESEALLQTFAVQAQAPTTSEHLAGAIRLMIAYL